MDKVRLKIMIDDKNYDTSSSEAQGKHMGKGKGEGGKVKILNQICIKQKQIQCKLIF